MKFTFQNFGNIKKGNIELGDLTLICGPNNVGKTYINYAIYGLLKNFEISQEKFIKNSQFLELKKNKELEIDLSNINIKSIVNEVSNRFSNMLEPYFNAPIDFFSKSKVKISNASLEEFDIKKVHGELIYYMAGGTRLTLVKHENSSHIIFRLHENEKKIKLSEHIFKRMITIFFTEEILSTYLLNPFAITSERTGISLFYKELDANRSYLIDSIKETGEGLESLQMSFENRVSRYAQPIKDNINTIRNYEYLIKEQSFILKEREKYNYVIESLEDLMGGKYRYKDQQVIFEKDGVSVPVYMTSSSIKSLFLLDLYIRHLATPKDILIIDEPELNLHPDNQRKVASLLTKLVNAGIKVLVTTHSDFLIREINNRIMLSSNVENKELIMEKAGLINKEILNPKQVRAYSLCDDQEIKSVKVDQYGVNMESFDSIISDANMLSEKIYFNMK